MTQQPAIPTVATERLIMRPFTMEDAEPLFTMQQVKGVRRYMPTTDPPTEEQVREMILGSLDHWCEHGFGRWSLERREAAGFIGWCGLKHLSETDEVEVAYMLARDHWGRGLATEAAGAAVRFGFETVGLKTIVALVHPDNKASRRVIEKLKMAYTGRHHYFGMECCRYVLDRE